MLSVSSYANRINVTWSGDTVYAGPLHFESIHVFDSRQDFFGYDTSVIAVSGWRIIPIRVGTTTLMINSKGPPRDTIQLEVKEKNGRLVLRGERVSKPFYSDSVQVFPDSTLDESSDINDVP
jgi:hypothetical protein